MRLLIFLILTTLAALMLSAVWYFSPLALGMASSNWTNNTEQLNLALSFYWVSYKFCVPVMLVAQVFAIMMGIKGYSRTAYLVPAVSLSAFVLCAGAAHTLLLR